MDDECDSGKSRTGTIPPPWITTFADLMSLLLAFFVLLFSFSEMDKQAYKQIAGSMRDAFGIQREIRVREPPKGMNIVAREFSPGVPQLTPLNIVRQMTTEDNHAYPMSPAGSPQPQEASDQRALEAMKALAAKVRAEGEHVQMILNEEVQKGLVELELHDRMIVIRIQERGLFASGRAEPSADFGPIIQKIGEAIRYTHGQVVVAGHTDNVPIYSARFRSNWDLSSARAVTVLEDLIPASGLPKERFQVQGHGDTRPVDDNGTVAGRARNRRVEVTLLYNSAPAKSLDLPSVSAPDASIAPGIPGEPAPDGQAPPQSNLSEEAGW